MNAFRHLLLWGVILAATAAYADDFHAGNWRSEVAALKALQASARTNTSYRASTDFDSLCAFFVCNALGLRHTWAPDPKSPPVPPALLEWEKRHATTLDRWQPLANFGLVYSDRSQKIVRRPSPAWANLCTAFLDSALPFRAVTDRDLDEGHFTGLDTLYLPSVSFLSDRAAEHIRAFVRNGGTVVATGNTSCLDEKGNPRGDFALAGLFGVKLQRANIDEKARVEKPPASRSAPTEWLPYEEQYCEVKVTDPGTRMLTMLEDGTGHRHPAAILRTFGKGRILYYAFSPETRATRNAPGAWREMIINAAMTRAEPPVAVLNIVPGIFVNASVQKFDNVDNVIVTLANFLGEETPGGIVRSGEAWFPEVKPRLPRPKRPIQIRLFRTTGTAAWLLSPDNPKPVALRVGREGHTTELEVKNLDRFAFVVLVRGQRDLVKELE